MTAAIILRRASLGAHVLGALAVLLSLPAVAAARGVPEVPSTRLACGATVTGSLDLGGQQLFAFVALPGDVVALEAVETGGSGELLQLRMAGPGLRVTTCTGRIDPSSAPARFGRLDGGTYGILVRDCLDDQAVDYSLTLHVVSQSPRNCGTPLRCGATAEGDLSVPGEVAAFRLLAERGDVIHLDVDSDAAIRGGLEVRVFGPDGQPLGDRTTARCSATPRFRAEASGTHTVLVNACWGIPTGDYSIRWTDDSCEAVAQPSPTPTQGEERTPPQTPPRTLPPTATPTPTPIETTAPSPQPQSCAGDCDGDGRITVDEILALVTTSLLGEATGDCPAGDTDDNGRITVDEVVAAIHHALRGCQGT